MTSRSSQFILKKYDNPKNQETREFHIYASGEDYLEAILMIQAKKSMVRSVDIARHMEFKKSSVSCAVSNLRNGGYLTVDENGCLHLTEMGREIAEKIYDRHKFFTARLIESGVDPVRAEQDACKMEHAISEESYQKLKNSFMSKKIKKDES